MADDPEFAALAAEHEVLLGFLYLCPAGVVQIARDGTVQLINPHAAMLLMPVVRVPTIANLFEALEDCCPELRHLASEFDAETGQICHSHRIVLGGRGSGPKVLSCSLVKVGADNLVAILNDISVEVERERQLKQSEALFSALVAGVNDFALFTLDSKGRINSWNQSGVRLTGFAAAQMLGRDLDVLRYPDNAERTEAAEQLLAVGREGWSLRESSCRRQDGGRYWSQILVAALEGPGGIEGYSVVVRDVTERRVTGDELNRLLTTDNLTGASNRARFFEVAEREIARRAQTGQSLAAIMLDVDRFKRVNDVHGHAAGDRLLRALVRSCRACLHEGDTLARLGGEEFAVLLPGSDLAGAMHVAELMRATVAANLAILEGVPIAATISLGCAELADDHDGIDSLLCAADEAMYRAKRAGRNQVMAAAVAAPATQTKQAHAAASA